jgi:hypothetical protein
MPRIGLWGKFTGKWGDSSQNPPFFIGGPTKFGDAPNYFGDTPIKFARKPANFSRPPGKKLRRPRSEARPSVRDVGRRMRKKVFTGFPFG